MCEPICQSWFASCRSSRPLQGGSGAALTVHLDLNIIEAYLDNIQKILRPGANAVIQYSDKTKVMARLNDGFSDNDPDRMRSAVQRRGYKILEEDITTLWHSSVIRFTI